MSFFIILLLINIMEIEFFEKMNFFNSKNSKNMNIS